MTTAAPRIPSDRRSVLIAQVLDWRDDMGELRAQIRSLEQRLVHLGLLVAGLEEELGVGKHAERPAGEPGPAPDPDGEEAPEADPDPPRPEAPAEPAAVEPEPTPPAAAAGAPPRSLHERVARALEDLTSDGSWAQADRVGEAAGISTGLTRAHLEKLDKAGRAESARIEPDEPRYHPRAKWKYRIARGTDSERDEPARGADADPAPEPADGGTGDAGTEAAGPAPPSTPEEKLAAASLALGRWASVSEVHKASGTRQNVGDSAAAIEAGVRQGTWEHKRGALPDNPLVTGHLYRVAELSEETAA